MSKMHHFCTHSAPTLELGKGALTRLLLGFLSLENPNYCTITGVIQTPYWMYWRCSLE